MIASIRRIVAIALGMMSLFSGCAHQTGTITRSAASFLMFKGDATDARITIDGRTFNLTKDNAKDHFEITPGVHRVTIEKQGRVVVDREILLSDRQTIEVAIP